MKINLSKKNYVISAGADGLGFAIANKIISSGGKVYLSDINKSKIDKINSNKKYRNKIFAQHLDCTNPKDIKEYFKSLSNLKKIDGLINNIGIAGPTKYLQNISNIISDSQKHLRNLDEKGVFEADDEVGYFFEQMKNDEHFKPSPDKNDKSFFEKVKVEDIRNLKNKIYRINELETFIKNNSINSSYNGITFTVDMLDDNPEVKAYIQVRDLTKKDRNNVFVFNGWMFSSSPSIAPFDHPVYDIWLVNCY